MDIEVLSKNNELKEESYSFDLRRDQNVVMTNKFIEGRWTLDIITSRVFFMALAMVHDTHTSETQYVIEIKKLKDFIEYKGNSLYASCRSCLITMAKTLIEVKTNDKYSWEAVQLIVKPKISSNHEGYIAFQFDSSLLPHIKDFKNELDQIEPYTSIKLSDILQFKCMYSMRLFFLIKQYQKLVSKRIMSIVEIRSYFDLDKTSINGYESDKHKAFKDLNSRVLKPAIKELNKFGFYVTMKQIKQGNKVMMIEFNWKKPASIIHSILQTDSEPHKRMIIRLREGGLFDTQIIKLFETGISLGGLNKLMYSFNNLCKSYPPENKAKALYGYIRKIYFNGENW